MGNEQLAISPSALECCRTARPRDSSATTKWRPRKPVAPVTKISFFIWQELLSTIVKLFHCAHVVVHAANIQPIAGMALHMHRFFARQHVQHKVVEAVLL